MLDLKRCAYLYAQGLDNSGDTEYWVACDDSGQLERLDAGDSRLRPIRASIDQTMQVARRFPFETAELEGRAQLSGDCVITMRPETLDRDGRVSPVLVLFNAYGDSRHYVANALRGVPFATQRVLSAATLNRIDMVQRELGWPRWILYFRLRLANIRSAKLLNLTSPK